MSHKSSAGLYLSLHIDLGSLAYQQRSHVRVALLGGQMERSDALLGQNVGLGSVLQQHRGDFHLVLLGGDVEGSVAVLMHGDSEGEKTASLLDLTFFLFRN